MHALLDLKLDLRILKVLFFVKAHLIENYLIYSILVDERDTRSSDLLSVLRLYLDHVIPNHATKSI